KLGCLAQDYNEATHVGFADSLDLSTKFENKINFRIIFYDTINTLAKCHIQQIQENPNIILFSINQHVAELFKKFNIKCYVIGPGIDSNYWARTRIRIGKPFIILTTNFSNHRSSIDLLIQAFDIAFNKNNDVKLVIKNTSDSVKLQQKILEYQKKCNNIEYINKRITFSELRDLFSEAHVVSNIFRFSQHGLSIGECQSVGALSLAGWFDPSNRINGNGVYIKPSKTVEIRKTLPYLVNEWGLTDCFGDLEHFEEPLMYDYDKEELANLLKEIYLHWDEKYSNIDTRTPIVEKWNWTNSAQKLVEYLSE
ncbi:MAG: hypothetical protein AABY22_06200, partial [Nanoarchaeota archaeon]